MWDEHGAQGWGCHNDKCKQNLGSYCRAWELGGWEIRCFSSTNQDRTQLANTNIQGSGQADFSWRRVFHWNCPHVMKIYPLGNLISCTWVLYPSSNILILIWFLMVSSLEEKELMGSNLLNDYAFSSLMTLPWCFWHWIFCSKLFSLSGMIVIFPPTRM